MTSKLPEESKDRTEKPIDMELGVNSYMEILLKNTIEYLSESTANFKCDILFNVTTVTRVVGLLNALQL